MNFNEIFQAYYALYRADNDIPASGDTEYIVGMRMANEAINYWANYDGTYWNQLWSTNQIGGTAGQTIVAGTNTYDLPDDFAEIGGYIQLIDANGSVRHRIPRLDPQEVQFRVQDSDVAYIADGQLVFNKMPNSDNAGMIIDYPYYRTPTTFEKGTDTTEMANPYFIVHRMLAQQFRASRNPYYQSALRDAEDAVRKMQLDNNSGSWDNPPQMVDNSGGGFGI